MKGTLAIALLLLSGSILGTSAQAAGWHGPRVVIVPRVRYFGYGGFYPYAYGPYYSYYGRYDGGPADVAEQQGYHDGFDRGREDARDRKIHDPNNSSHFRDSRREAYRDGFRRGYEEGYGRY
jgi:hypothetical protein